jgi:hypothetical protein
MFNPDPGSKFFPFRIPDPGSKRYRIPDPDLHQRIEVFSPQKLFLSSWKYDPDCSLRIRTRIRILIFYPSQIPDPGVKKAPDPGSGTLQKYYFTSVLNYVGENRISLTVTIGVSSIFIEKG